ncbi:ribosome biogenesis protein bop1 [Gambusia affinis]|uniref:ribosome biogenesis protein bop1 n=1 Tax=Gambusia affinis TaxID=33528 RepID=UPI001CDCE478|nr:ribosome biogenesis protein bop1 [Gambusia affinis]
MEASRGNVQKAEQRAGMKKTEKTNKKRSKQDDEEEEEDQLFNLNNKSLEEDDEDLSDSEESVYSGLQDSGSDSDEEEEEEAEGGSDDEDEQDQNEKSTVKKSKKKERADEEKEVKKEDEYNHDTSDEEDIRNTVGNIPMEWYKDFPHVGYDLDGKKIFKPIRNKDELDDFLEKMENPDYWRTVHDKKTASDIVLSDEQIELVNRLQKGQFGDVNFNEYEVFMFVCLLQTEI